MLNIWLAKQCMCGVRIGLFSLLTSECMSSISMHWLSQ